MQRTLAVAWAALVLVVAGCDDTGTTADPPDTSRQDGAVDGPPPDPDEGPPVYEPPGAPCDGPDDCPSGLCLGTADGGRCTIPCDPAASECPVDWFCGDSVALDGAVCQPVRALCDPCETDDACGGPSDLCLPLLGAGGGARVCARDCSNVPCPDGFVCRDVGQSRQCQPADDICPDAPPDDGPDDNCPDVPNPDQLDGDGDGVGDACDACPGELGDGPDGCPRAPGELRFHGGQFLGAAGPMSAGPYRLRLTLGAREPIHRMRTPGLRLRPLSLGRTP